MLPGEAAVVDRTNIPDDEAREAEFVRLLTSYQLDIYLYIHSLMPDFAESADIVQDTNTVLWEKRKRFEMGTDFRAWAFQIARYELSEHRAKRKRSGLCFSDALVDELAIHVPRYTHADEDLMDDLRRCVAQLAARDRELLDQRYSSRATCDSIAKAISRPVRWVHNALSRIRQELRDCITRNAHARREQ
jgi:RNA polymerase sigma-70 factor, ECF subfamily